MKGAFSIDKVLQLALAIFAGVIILGILLPMIMSQNASSGCGTPYTRAVASILADMTGANIC